MSRGYYITHPQVVMDPAVPVPRWGLSPLGRQRIEALAARAVLPPTARIVSSTETKAVETARILAAGRPFESGEAFGENDRSSTGFLPRDAFEAMADAFFGQPEISTRGWERAVDAQARIVGALDSVLSGHDPSQPIVLVGHGAVGTLLKCHLAGRAISRAQDQLHGGDAGGGNFFVFSLADRRLLSDWQPIELLGRP